MSFRFYITDLVGGKLWGTNNEVAAYEYADSEDYFVVDAVTNMWLLTEGDKVTVEEIQA